MRSLSRRCAGGLFLLIALLAASLVNAESAEAQYSQEGPMSALARAGAQDNGAHIGGHTVFAVPGSFESIGTALQTGSVGLLEVEADGSFGGSVIHQGSPGIPGGNERGDQFGTALAWGDIDNNGVADLVVGSPFEDIGSRTDAGAIAVLFDAAEGSFSRAQLLHQGSPGVIGANEADDRWGFSVATGDLDDDGFVDVIVGAPGEDIGRSRDTGAVTVLFGGPRGLSGTGSELFHQGSPGVPSANETGDLFGFSVAITGGFAGIDKWAAVGAPGEDISGVVDAGSVTVFETEFDGGPVPRSPALYPGAPAEGVRPEMGGIIQTDDFFGFHLSSDPTFLGIMIGSPFVDVNGQVDSGVVFFYLPPSSITGDPASADFFLATNEAAGNLYGHSIDIKLVGGDVQLAVGAPGMTVNGRVDAGGLEVGTLTDDFLITQADSNVPGNAETGDLFGWHVDALLDGTVLVTAPSEDIGNKTDVGAGLLLFSGGDGSEPGSQGARGVHQDTAGVAGVGETNDFWGG